MVVDVVFVLVADMLCAGLSRVITRALKKKKPCKQGLTGHPRGRHGGREVA